MPRENYIIELSGAVVVQLVFDHPTGHSRRQAYFRPADYLLLRAALAGAVVPEAMLDEATARNTFFSDTMFTSELTTVDLTSLVSIAKKGVVPALRGTP